MPKTQVIVIHGGDVFETHEDYLAFLKNYRIDFDRYRAENLGWKRNLSKDLGEKFEVILPDMPSKTNSKYSEWKLWFEKFIPYFAPEVILIGHSLGGIFLAKYLSENDFPRYILGTFLVAAPYDGEGADYSLGDFALSIDFSKFKKQGGKIFLYQSKDDPVVPFADFEKYQKELPSTTTRVFTDRGHFKQQELPELVKDIRLLAPKT